MGKKKLIELKNKDGKLETKNADLDLDE